MGHQIDPRDQRRTLNDVIDDLGFGMAQVRLVTLAGGLYYVDGTVMTLFLTLPVSVASELGLHPFQRALLLAATLTGKLFGNWTNAVNDYYLGRRKPILVAYAISILFVCLSGLFYSYYPILVCWAICGFGLGFGTPAWNSLSSESSPVSKRTLVNGGSVMMYSVASFIVIVTFLQHSPTLDLKEHWRKILPWLLIPCAFLFLTALLVGFVDSAHVFLAQGKPQAARRVLETMREQNGRPYVSLDFQTDASFTPRGGRRSTSIWNGMGTLFGRRLALITFSVSFCTFVLNFVGYGVGYSVPIVLPTLTLALSPAVIMCCNPVMEVIGLVIGIYLSRVVTRRHMITAYLAASITFVTVLVWGLSRLEHDQTDAVGQSAVLLVSINMPLVTAPGWLVVYVYASEVFPTMCRSFGTGFVVGCGRFGSVAAPFVFEALHIVTGSYLTFYGLLAVMMLANAIIVLMVLPETQDRPLEEFLGDGEDLPLKG